MPRDSVTTYQAEPTLARFHANRQSFVRGVRGPIGSGKSVGCVMEMTSKILTQPRGQGGIRRSRWGVIRNTYPELRTTTIKTFQDWVPEKTCSLVYHSPIEGTFRHYLGRDQNGEVDKVEAEIYFIALDKPKDIKRLLSLELTGAWVNEAREIPKAVLDVVTERVGRYPPKKLGGFGWSGVIMDTNSPDDMHWWYQMAEEECPEGWMFYTQPGALMKIGKNYHPNPAAENVHNQPLGYDYWLRMLAGKKSSHIRVYILNEYGSVEEGKPIYEEQWNDSFHVAQNDLVFNPHLPILCGWDFGLTPAVVLAQVTPRGRLNILDEIIGDNIGVRQFAENHVLPHLATNYPTAKFIHIGDPSGGFRSDTDESTVFDELRSPDIGIDIEAAPTNNQLKRWECVRYFLTMLRDDGPAFLLDKRCKILRKGFNGGYRFRQMMVSGAPRYAEKPDKNEFSHANDGLQYICSHLRRDFLISDKQTAQAVNKAPSYKGWT